MTRQEFVLERFGTPTGPMLLLSDEEDRVRALDWDDHAPRFHQLLERHYGSDAVDLRASRKPSNIRKRIDAYFNGELDALEGIQTATGGTAFQQKVWAALREISVGRTASYADLAARIGQPSARRAVGLANGANPIAIIVPCHRVIGADGSLTGYGGGLERKRWLLAHEGALSDLL